MPLLKIKRSSQITIPLELRKRFGLDEGDYLEASGIPDGILLRPVIVIDKTKNAPAQVKEDWGQQFSSWVASHQHIKAVALDDSREAMYGDDER